MEIDILVTGTETQVRNAGETMFKKIRDVWPEARAMIRPPTIGIYKDAETKRIWENMELPTGEISHTGVLITGQRSRDGRFQMVVTLGDINKHADIAEFAKVAMAFKEQGMDVETKEWTDEEVKAQDEKSKALLAAAHKLKEAVEKLTGKPITFSGDAKMPAPTVEVVKDATADLPAEVNPFGTPKVAKA